MADRGLFDDLDTLTAPFGAALDAHLGDVPRARPDLLAGVSFGHGTPLLDDLLAGVGTGQRPDLFGGATAGGSANLFGGVGFGGSANPFGGVSYGGGQQPGGGGNILGNLFSGIGSAVHNLFAGAFDKDPNKPAAPNPRPGGGVTEGSGGTAGGYTGSGTASDNAGITGQKVDQFIASKFADSPLVGKGQLILDYANARGVSVPEAVGIFWKESGMGTTAGPGWNLAGLGGAGNFAQYATIDDAIRGAIDNLASDLYRGKSVQDHIGYWFVGPQRYAQSGLNADDGTGGRNGTVGDYLNNFIAPTYAALGAPYNQTGAPSRQAGGGSYHGVGGLPSLTGGTGSIGQEFGDTDYSAGNPIYDYGAGAGVHGHTGIDWAVPPGTQVYMPAGLSGEVITAGGTAFFRDEDENPSAVSPAGQGELKIRLSNGMELILGHMRSINVPVGTQLTAGQAVGLAGSANGGHIHVELRVPDPSLPNGYRIIDPRTILGGATGGGGNLTP